jgi:hypothetical protein
MAFLLPTASAEVIRRPGTQVTATNPRRASRRRAGLQGRGPQAQPDVAVGRLHQRAEGVVVRRPPPAQLHVPHALAGALQQACRVFEGGPVEEPDVHVSAEGVDVRERRVFHAGRGMAVVQPLANVGAAAAHPLEPWPGDPPQRVAGPGEPGVDVGVSPHGAREAEYLAHRPRLAARRAMSSRPGAQAESRAVQ